MKHPGIVFNYDSKLIPTQKKFWTVLYAKDLSQKRVGESSVSLDPYRESCLLPGEPLTLLEHQDGFVRVQAWWQPKWNIALNRFEPYEGWILNEGLELIDFQSDWKLVTSHQGFIRKKPTFDELLTGCLPMAALYRSGDCLLDGWHQLFVEGHEVFVHDKDLSEWDWLDDCFEDVIRWQWRQGAARLKGLSYVLGGLRTDSSKVSLSKVMQGVDCSGLLHLSARRMGRILPRDAKDQYRFFMPLEISKVEPGDLVFLGVDSPGFIDHVIMQEEVGYWLESSRNYSGVVFHDSKSRKIQSDHQIWAASASHIVQCKEVGE